MPQMKIREKKGKKTVFLDRDGTMNVEVHYLHRLEDLKLIPGTAKAVRMFNEAGFRVVVVTNQAGVARGYYGEEEVRSLHLYLNELLKKENAHVDDFYYCPHHPEHGIGIYRVQCQCRKPGTGMFEAADRDCPVDKEHSFMVGDKLIDTMAGHKFGVRSILVGTGYGEAMRENRDTEESGEYDWYAEDLLEAAKLICSLDHGAFVQKKDDRESLSIGEEG